MKTTMYKIVIVFVISISSFMGCVNHIEVDLPENSQNEEFVLIYGYLSPEQDSLKVSVSKTYAFLDISNPFNEDPSNFIIKDATVIIKNESGEQVDLLYNSITLNYEAQATDFPIIPGATYFLEILIEDQKFSSSCVIPTKNIEKIEHSISTETSSTGLEEEFLNIRFKDIQDQHNYYVLSTTLEREYFDRISFFQNAFINDQNRDGDEILISAAFSRKDGLNSGTILLNVVDKIIYETFLASYENGDLNFFQLNQNRNVVIPPNNIEGEGVFGVFAGYRLLKKEIQF